MRKEFPPAEAWNGRPVILFSDYPEPEMMETFYKLKAPIAICLDDFATIAHFAVASRDFSGSEATRFATMGLVNLERASTDPPPHSLAVRDRNTTLPALIHGLAWLYQLPIDADGVRRVLASCGFPDKADATLGDYEAKTLSAYDNARQLLEQRSPLENELIDFVAPQYDPIASGRRLDKLEWPVYALLRPEFPNRLTLGPIDLTGPARCVYHGPYFALPPAVWTADISFEVQDCLSDNRIALDICAGKTLGTITAQLPPRGVFGCQIWFRVEQHIHFAEVRVHLLTGAIEGMVQMRRIVLHRLRSLEEEDSQASP
ncbi:MAG: hypothetical protein JO288_08780 [Hyphomicrobiales bacterium]|nr:hypothetical protein [Hyphomicrobiales bacterium]